jgi:hypothetical protein
LEKITSRTFSQQLDLIFITSINLDGKECWNSLIKMFFKLSLTFINHIWIKFTLDTNWIGSIFNFITSINLDSTECWNS